MKRLSKEEKLELCSLYETGNYSFKDLDKYFKLGLGSSRGLLLRRGYKAKSLSEINRKYSLNESYFDNIDCEEKAYMLGFLYADGCNFPEGTRIVIGLHEKDKEILEKFKILLRYQRPLQYKKSSNSCYRNSSSQYILTISSKKISKRLEELGMVKAKSLILTFPTEDQVPKELQRHFIRGYFDGDGTITSSSPISNKQGRKSDVKWNIIGTEQFTRSVQNIMVENLDFSKTKLQKVKNVFYLEYKGGKQIDKIRKWLYNNSTIFLERKHNKFINYASDVAIPE